MKNVLFAVAFVAALVMGNTGQNGTVYAEPQTKISGVVTANSGLPAAGAVLYIGCGTSSQQHIIVDHIIADGNGYYEAFFDSSLCTLGSSVWGSVYSAATAGGTAEDVEDTRINGSVTSLDMTLNLRLTIGHLNIDPMNDNTSISGVITSADPSGNGSNPISATVACADVSQQVSPNPNDNNRYYVEFNPAECPEGASVTVTATQNGNTGVGYGEIVNGDAIVDVSLVPLASVPEMGTIAAMGAVGAVGAMFFMARRKQMQNV